MTTPQPIQQPEPGTPVPMSPAPPAYGPPPGYPVAGYPYQPIAVQLPPTSGFAVASLVFGLIGVFGGFCALGIPCLIAVVCGHAGLSDAKKLGKRGHGMAIAGLILGYLFIIPAVIFLVTGGIGSLFS